MPHTRSHAHEGTHTRTTFTCTYVQSRGHGLYVRPVTRSRPVRSSSHAVTACTFVQSRGHGLYVRPVTRSRPVRSSSHAVTACTFVQSRGHGLPHACSRARRFRKGNRKWAVVLPRGPVSFVCEKPLWLKVIRVM